MPVATGTISKVVIRQSASIVRTPDNTNSLVETFVSSFQFDKALFCKLPPIGRVIFSDSFESLQFRLAMAEAMANDKQLEKNISSTVFRLRLQPSSQQGC